MKTLLVLLVACTLATSGHTSAAISGESQTLDAGEGGRLRSTVARSEAQSLLWTAEATVGEELAHFKPGPVRRLVAFLAEVAGIPLPTINHQKTPGNGYSPGSPMFNDQEAWVARNGNNVRNGVGDDLMIDDVNNDLRWALAGFFGYIVLTLVLNILLFVLFAYLYHHYSAGWRQTRFLEQVGTHQDFLHSPFDPECLSGEKQFDWQICLCAICCPLMRWADTVGNPKMFAGKFWLALFTMLILYILCPILLWVPFLIVVHTWAPWLSCCGPCIIFSPITMVYVYVRQQMRTKFGHDAGKPWTLVYDIALWCCCPCCAIVQEAREVEKVNPGLVRKVTTYSTYGMQSPA